MGQVEDQVEAAVGDLTARLSQELPEVKDILTRARAGLLTEAAAMEALTQLVQARPALAEALALHAKAAFAPLREAGDPNVLFHSGVGLPQLNPLMEAALVERLQFDGDAPELRTGPLPEGVLPAIPVVSLARDPAVLGRQLQMAADSLGEEIRAHEQQRLANTDFALVPQTEGALEAVLAGSAETDHPAYRRGEVPELMPIATPDGFSLALMTPEAREGATWTLLSTTQGRRSMQHGIAALVAEQLHAEGFPVTVPEVPVQGWQVLAVAFWDVDLANSLQPRFSFMDVASRAMTIALAKQLTAKPLPASPLYLNVTTVNGIADRVAGWVAQVLTC